MGRRPCYLPQIYLIFVKILSKFTNRAETSVGSKRPPISRQVESKLGPEILPPAHRLLAEAHLDMHAFKSVLGVKR